MDRSAEGTGLTLSARLRTSALAATAFLAVAAGALVLSHDSGSDRVVAVTADDAPSSAPTTGASTGDDSAQTSAVADATPPNTAPSTDGLITEAQQPVHVSVPEIGADAPVISLGLQANGKLEVPATASDTGWWSGGSVPGAVGPAVIAGHINLGDEEGVFSQLGSLQPDDEVSVTLDTGRILRYRIDRVERHAKEAFPTDAVYGKTTGPELRLVTCGGAFDPSSGHYLDNVIAFATPVP